MRKLLLTFIFILSANTFAQEFLILERKNRLQEEIVLVNEFLKEVEQKIPEIIKKNIKKPISIEFVNFKENEHLDELPDNKCEEGSNFLYAQINTFDRDTIKVTTLLIPEIMAGDELARKFDCGHKNYYRLAMATILHEIAHIYDYKKIRSNEHKKNVNSCREKHSNKWINDEFCRAVKQQEINRKTVSGKFDFYKLANWQQKFFSKASKNLSTQRSVDPYEYKNLDEHYAVNFEYFLLDPDFKCKRPSYYQFYEKEFQVSPFKDSECSINSVIYLDDKKTAIDINPSRVYRVDYLLASKGEALMSGFGHSMFRLVVCAPFRKVASAECIKDRLYHVVLSYRANVTDIKSDAIKGVFGGYDSILYALSMSNVIEEYTMGELRDLLSLPIKFSEAQKERFIKRVLETYWEYAGNYKFLSSNCASESHDLLQSAMLDHKIKYGNIIKPYSLMEVLIEKGLSEDGLFEDRKKAIAQGILFESEGDKLEKIKMALFGLEDSDYKIIKRPTPGKNSTGSFKNVKKKKEIKEILTGFDINKLKAKFAEIQGISDSNIKRESLKNLSVFSQGVMRVRQFELDEEIGDYLEKLEEEDGAMAELLKSWNDKRKKFRVTPLDQDYGIPLKITEDDMNTHETSIKELEESETQLVENVKKKFEEKVEELSDLKILIDEMRAKNKINTLSDYITKE